APGSTAIEFQFVGPVLEFIEDASLAIVGGECCPLLDGQPVPTGEVFVAPSGARLDCGAIRRGARAYLAVAGGVAAAEVLGSSAPFPRASLGGGTLATGDVLHLRAPEIRNLGWALLNRTIVEPGDSRVEVVAGPHLDWLS